MVQKQLMIEQLLKRQLLVMEQQQMSKKAVWC